MKIAILAVTEEGEKTAEELRLALKDSQLYALSGRHNLAPTVQEIFHQYDGLIFIMALGIVIRVIAPCLDNKHVDPAVVAVDESRRFAISALSGHEGGANRLAAQVASILGAEPVITTASEGKKRLILGVGCRRGATPKQILETIDRALKAGGCSIGSIRCAATIDFKAEEPGLREACETLGIPLQRIPYDWVKQFSGSYERSAFIKEKIGVEGVSEPCALLAGKRTRLIVPRIKQAAVCVAIARED